MSAAQYDEVSPPLLEALQKAPGFKLHVAFVDAQGFCVAEIWDSQDSHDRFFNENVAPNVPFEIQQEVIEVHNVVKA